MKFLNSPYELNIEKINNNIFVLRLSTICNTILEIKFDSDYLLSLYGYLDNLYINSVNFEIIFPLTSTVEFFKITGLFRMEDYNVELIITQQNIYGLENKYSIIIEAGEEFGSLLTTIEEYIFDYLTEQELEDYCSDMDSMCMELMCKSDGRQYNLIETYNRCMSSKR